MTLRIELVTAVGRLKLIRSVEAMVWPPPPKLTQVRTDLSAVTLTSRRLLPVSANVAAPDVTVTLLAAVLGIAHSGTGNVAKGPATNTERNNFLNERLVIGLFFIGG